jgi:hypothetical protein
MKSKTTWTDAHEEYMLQAEWSSGYTKVVASSKKAKE